MSALPGTPEHIAGRQLEAWSNALVGEGPVVALRGAGGRDALAGQPGASTVTWLDAPADALPAERLAELAGAGIRLVLAVAGLDRERAPALARRIGATLAGEQVQVQGLLISDPDGPVTARVSKNGIGGHGRPRRTLLTANIDAEALEQAASAELAVVAEDVRGAQLERLEAAYWSMRRANTRLARENLGRHDAAAASVVGPLTTELEHLRRQLEIEIGVARRNDEYFQAARAKLDEPHHRAAERLFQVLTRVPGGRAITAKALSRGR